MRGALATWIVLAVATSARAEPPVKEAAVEAAAPSRSEPARSEPAPTLVVAPAAGPTAPNLAAAPVTTPGAETATAEPTPRPASSPAVRRVELRKSADDTVCRRERPTGSLISVRRCSSRSATAQRKDDEVLRSDLDYIRQQENDRQSREAANAMMGRRPGP